MQPITNWFKSNGWKRGRTKFTQDSSKTQKMGYSWRINGIIGRQIIILEGMAKETPLEWTLYYSKFWIAYVIVSLGNSKENDDGYRFNT